MESDNKGSHKYLSFCGSVEYKKRPKADRDNPMTSDETRRRVFFWQYFIAGMKSKEPKNLNTAKMMADSNGSKLETEIDYSLFFLKGWKHNCNNIKKIILN